METRNKLYMYVYRMILTDIFNGIYGYESKLPTLPDLCVKYNVGRNTVRSALLQLQADGYISLRRGAQAKVILDHNNEQMHKQYKQVLMDSRKNTENVFSTMTLLFPYLACLSLKNATKEQVDQLYTKVNHFNIENIHSEEHIIKELFDIYETGFSFLNNPVLNDLIITLLYSMYYPSFPNVDERADFEKSVKRISVIIKTLIKVFLSKNDFIVRNMVKGLCLSYAKLFNHYIEETCVGMTPKKEKTFIWTIDSDDDYLYMKVVFGIIMDIKKGEYQKGDLLPSIAQLSEKYDVSDRTSRRALRALNEYSLVKTINGVGSKVTVKNLVNNKKFLASPEIRKNIITYYHSSQIIMIFNHETITNVLNTLSNEERKELVTMLRSEQEFSLNSFFDYIYKKTNQCLYSIYKELQKQKIWGVIANIFLDRTYYNTEHLKRELLDALEKGNTSRVCDIAQELMEISTKLIEEYV